MIQVLGLAGTLIAIVVPTVVLSSYLNPTAEIRVDNRTPYVLFLTVDKNRPCGNVTEYAQPHTLTSARFRFGEGGHALCEGYEAHEFAVYDAQGGWTCAWSDAKAHEPLVITEAGPDCTPTSYTPGILRQPTTTGGPPFSPPAR